MKERWGMHLKATILKLRSNESELSKKKCTFLDYFFFLSILEAGASVFESCSVRTDLIRKKFSCQ